MDKASEKALADVNRVLSLDLKQAEPWALVAICVAEIENQNGQTKALKLALLDLIGTSATPDAKQHPTIAAAYERAINQARAIIIKTGGIS
ncbi:hypothetical protein TH25_19145 [Thalassospira profundimaris]|uniref:Tetratricopeptide repeat protein n=1 Tax=Thalassospira profundimaris TaxID=502049 RepID=A0A367WVW8_9PROT|nr:hypothetical protein [Thalassospira profundimaris]RCK44780.1 hypothetical protein TH25_19145 [Thalassospira profundimaris]